MSYARSNNPDSSLVSLDAVAVSARNAFACMFSTSEEYEASLIRERRAEGRYRTSSRLPVFAFWGCAIAMALVALMASI